MTGADDSKLILVLNSGGSSFKFRLYEMPREGLAAAGVRNLGSAGTAIEAHQAALEDALHTLDGRDGTLSSLDQIDAIAHKLPHGGEGYMSAVRIDDDVIAAMERLAPVVPVHNPPVVRSIRLMRELLPDTPQYGTFETHFHVTLSPSAYRYALPEAWYTDHGIRRYGFHSCSHRFVTGRVAELLGRPADALRLVACHLGSGTSVCGIRDGRSVDISSAFTPQAGTPMSTRSGDFDPFVITYLMEAEGLAVDEVNRLLTKESGLAGLSGVGGDLRDVEAAAAEGQAGANLALDVFVFNIRRWIGACLMAAGGIDALSFTGGIGEHGALVRERVCADLDWLGLKLDDDRNQRIGEPDCTEGLISADDSRVAVAVVELDEEIVCARDAYRLMTEEAAS